MSISYASQAPWKISATYLKCAEMMPGLVKLPLLEIPAALSGAPCSVHKLEGAAPRSLVPTVPQPWGDPSQQNLLLGHAGSPQRFRDWYSCCKGHWESSKLLLQPRLLCAQPPVHKHSVQDPGLSFLLLCPRGCSRCPL